ncbi:MAG: hypothetical protein PHC58_04295 [Candidatus Omnitrophica bacterium]|nr:hypothetical protein [Candidatus Omnitrophota bacterium]
MKKVIFIFVMFLFCLIAVSSFAQESDVQEDFITDNVTIETSILGRQDVEGASASVDIISTRLGVECDFLKFGYTLSDYNWTNPDSLSFGNSKDDPWGSLHKINLMMRYGGKIDEKWMYMVLTKIDSGFENEVNNSFGYGLGMLGAYKFSPKFRIILGTLLSYDEIEETELGPIFGFLWDDGDDRGFSLNVGVPETYLKYDFNDRLSLNLKFDIVKDLYRLSDHSVVSEKGYFRDEFIGYALMLNYSFNKNMHIEFGPQIISKHEFNIYDRNGNKIDEYDIDDAFGFKLKFTRDF